ncbi:MAG TPA: hypothetical protein VGD98_01215 [Ktedonobacteraceae bacterium]
MRVAAVAFVLIVGAAVVLAFANTLNSWVLGGLLGGLAAILLCIPISLAIFTLVTRRQATRQRAIAQAQAQEEAEAARLADEFYEQELTTYAGENELLDDEEEALPNTRARYLPANNRRAPVSGYLALPPVDENLDPYDDEQETLVRRLPQNYPLQPRYPVRPLGPREELAPPAPTTGTTRRPATSSLAQHKSAALHQARQEAQQQRQKRATQKRAGQGTSSRLPQNSRSAFKQHARTSHTLHPSERTSAGFQPEDEYPSRQYTTRSSWQKEEDYSASLSTEELRTRYHQYPRQPAYPRNPRNQRGRSAEPWTGELEDEDQPRETPHSRRPRRDPERLSGNLRNPLVRRAPYLYEDDPLHEEFARQLDREHPITRRSSLYEHYEDDEDGTEE